MIGKQIQNYTIIKLIGEGGMGDVYLAEHNTIKRKVAIKVLKAELVKNEEIKKRFKNEASVMAQLQQVNIVGLLDYVEQEDGLYLIMEFVEGKTLDIFLAELNEPLNIERSKKIMLQILNAFSYAHQNGIVHRDVKPSNIIINSNDEIKVLDFGIAKIIGGSQHNLTKTGVHIGTVYYMSPEQVKAVEVDARSDIYSLGITFYELLAGFCPYKNAQSEYEIYNKIVNDPLISLEESLGNQYHEVWKVIKKATQKKPEDRFSSCEEFALALRNEIKIQEQKKTVVSKPEQQHKPARTEYFEEEKKSYKGLIVFLILAALISFGAYVLFSENNKKEDELITEQTKLTVAYVIVGNINLRETTSSESTSIGKINFGDTIQLIGDQTEVFQEKEFKIAWQKALWNDTEGWVAIKIDEQPTVGTLNDFEEMQKILNYEYNFSAEYGKARIWIFGAVRRFLNQKSWINDYSFMNTSKEQYKNSYRTIIKYHMDDENYRKDDPYDYVLMMQSKTGKKIALFLQAKKDKMGGNVIGFTLLPPETKLLAFEKYQKEGKRYYGNDFDIGELYLVNENYENFAILNDNNFSVQYRTLYNEDGYYPEGD